MKYPETAKARRREEERRVFFATWCICGLCLVALPTTTTTAGTIRTLDGKLYQGQIKLDANQIIVSSRSTSTTIPLDNLLVGNFKSPAGEDNALPPPWTA